MDGLLIKLRGIKMSNLTDDFTLKYKIVETKNNTDNLSFFYGVKTTGIFCKPKCSSRLPNIENIIFFNSANEALEAGFRACKRCNPLKQGLSDHEEVVLMICKFIEKENNESLEILANKSGYSQRHLQRIFKNMTGISPKEYSKTIRENKLRKELQYDQTVTDAMYNSGYSSVSRLYENIHKIIAMTPNQFKNFGKDLTLRVGTFSCSLGYLVVSFTNLGVSSIDIGDNLHELKTSFTSRFKNANIQEINPRDKKIVSKIISKIDNPIQSVNIPLDIHGTVFQKKVWKSLMDIPVGQNISYSELAKNIGEPKSVRAVANACGKNNISILIPCHRVVRKNGTLSGYKWGESKKLQIINSEKIETYTAE
jgi:AraC family transcriptional regulator, regulatory protein of adaptative response / methylated-DNA-[protein]-cysteine methyltransferase